MSDVESAAIRGLRARLIQGAEVRRVAGIVLRLLAGVGGGYGVAALFTMVFSVVLPMARAEALLTATMASFAIHAGVIIWAFAAGSVMRAWAGIAAPAVALGVALLLSQGQNP